jgi:putative flippase GtrA
MGGTHLIRRWFAFNGVGMIGVGVQLTALAVLTRTTGLHPVVATALAVETAILHNFLWHQRWTWRDRPSRSPRAALVRLARFHAFNGLISLVGNVAIVALLTPLGMGPVAASAIAIAVCSLVNFMTSEMVVFKTARTAAGTAAVLLLLPLTQTVRVAAAGPADMTAELTPATVGAWQRYEKQVDERYDRAASAGGDTYFAQDAFKLGSGWRTQVLAGQVPMAKLETATPGQSAVDIPDGKVHHWVGAVFLPRTRLDDVINRLKERAGRESESYSDVIASRLISRDGDRLKVFLKLRRDNIITVTYNTEHAVHYRALGATRASSRSVSTKIAELEDAGTPREREKPIGNDHGFLWRLNAYWRFEQTDGGVIVECESVSLSRGVPALLRVFVSGTVERIARDSLQNTLVSLKKEMAR